MSTLLMRTPGPNPDESPRNYLLRLTEANGYTDSSTIQSLVGRKLGYVVTVGWDYTELQSVLGPLVVLPKNFGYRASNKKTREGVSFGGHVLHPRHLGMGKSRICPGCVSELGYVPRAHDLKAFVACPMHGHMMLKHCPACGGRIKYSRPGLLICRCGEDLAKARMEPAPPPLVGLMEVLWEKVHGPGLGLLQARACGLPTSQLLAMDLEILCRTIVTLATAIIEAQDTKRSKRDMSVVSEFLPKVAEVLSAWPLKFKGFCRQYHHVVVGSLRTSMVFQAAFSWLFVRLYKNLKKKRSQTKFLIEAALQYGFRHWERRPILIKEVSLRKLDLPPKRYGSYADAAELLSWQPNTVQRWLKNGRLPAVILPGMATRYAWRVDLSKLAEMKFSAHRMLGLRPAAREVGLPYSVYRALAQDGAVPKKHIVEQRSCAAVEDLREYRHELLNRADPAVPSHALYRLRDLLDSQVPIRVKARLVEEIRKGDIQTFGRCRSIRNLLLARDLVDEYRRAKSDEGSTISIEEAKRQHDLGFYEARSIFVHLSGRRPHRLGTRKHIPKSALDQFLKEFVPLRVVAKQSGVHSIALRQKVESTEPNALLRISAACGPQSRSLVIAPSFVRRNYLIRVRRIAKRLPSPG